ncbi:hypothetical protein OAJ14_08185, partial [Polaribacter sp.]|nr:hypothetical protein [Polaribacter sp.]
MTDNEYYELINSTDLEKIKRAVDQIYESRKAPVIDGKIILFNRSSFPEKEQWIIEHYQHLLKKRNDIRKVVIIVLVVLGLLFIL